MSWFHNDTITQQLMIPDQQPKYFAWDSSRDGLPAAFITSHNTKQHALGSEQQLITLHKYAAVSRDHKHPSWEDISSNIQQVCEQTSSWLLHINISSKPTSACVTFFLKMFIYILLPLPESEPLVKTLNSFCKHPELYCTCWNLYCKLLLNCASNLNTPLLLSKHKFIVHIPQHSSHLYTSITFF